MSTTWRAMLEAASPYLGDLHKVLPGPVAGTVLVVCSLVCGMIIGAERRARHKPAGVRTLVLIAIGSTVFTFASILMAGEHGDRSRIAASVVTGVGFLGAGAIIHDRGTVVGLTTGATIWVVSAIGVLIGAGYAAAGLVFALVVVGALAVFRHHESTPP